MDLSVFVSNKLQCQDEHYDVQIYGWTESWTTISGHAKAGVTTKVIKHNYF